MPIKIIRAIDTFIRGSLLDDQRRRRRVHGKIAI